MRQRPLRQPGDTGAPAARPLAAALLGAAAWLTLVQCGPVRPEAEAHWVIEFPADISARDTQIDPPKLATRVRWVGSRLVLTVTPPERGQLTVRTKSTCPLTLNLTRISNGHTRREQARPWIDLGPPRADLGPGAQVRIAARPGCPEALDGRIEWVPVEGALGQFHTERGGFVVTGKLPDLDALFDTPLSVGLVPVAPSNQGRVVLEARFQKGDAASVTRLELTALSRSRGLPNIPTGASVLLGGMGWQLGEPGASPEATLESHAGYSLFRPKTAGHWLLTGPGDTRLGLRSAAYDEVPLDCTRGGCHEHLSGHSAGKMSDVLTRGLNGQLGTSYSAECALACHALGEPGVPDGGFQHVADMLGFDVSHAKSYADLPAALQRLSNVGCLSCHGPGAIPEPAARSSILRSDVCAYCHDAPPRYGHVAAWKQNRMSQPARGLTEPMPKDCAACHTTWGFLEANTDGETTSRQPPAGETTGLGCVTCHEVHQLEPSRALLRGLTPPPSASHLDANSFAASRPCLNCHAPRAPLGSDRQPWPAASAAALWLGRGGFARTGGELRGPAVHARAPEGCLSCHTGTGKLERGASHGFQANPKACQTCHQHPPPADTSARARSLLAALAQRVPLPVELVRWLATADGVAGAIGVPHAHAGELDVSSAPGRAAYNLLLLLEDPAAGIHNPDYAKLLLEHSEGMLQSHTDEPKPPHAK